MFKIFIISLNKLSEIVKLKNITLVSTFFCLWLSSQLSPVLQDYLAYAFILTFGVLHGANDITLIHSLSKGKKPIRVLLLVYLGAMALVAFFFLLSKGLALLFFILISAYHFGEQHFNKQFTGRTRWKVPLFMSYGFLILFMIFNIKLDKVVDVIADLTGLVLMASVFKIVLVVALLVFLMLSILLFKKRILNINPLRELLYLTVLTVVFATSSLIWGFAIYFILWHSLPSMKDQLGYLYGEATKKSFVQFLRTSFLYWFISIAGLALLYWLLKDSVHYFVTVLLYVLAAITFPHVIVMSKVESSETDPKANIGG
ncbi:hypothetical protein FGF1_28010 [Flavobacteriaceae bacterium GF1]